MLFKEFNKTSTKEWIAKVEKDLKGKPLDSLTWEAEDDILVKPFYRKEDLENIPPTTTRKSTNDWFIQEEIEMGMGVTFAKKTNEKLLEALKFGVSAPNLVLDEVLDNKSFSKMLNGVFLNMIYLNFSGLLTESHPLEILKLLQAEIKNQKLSSKKCKGALDVDPIGFYIENEEYYESKEADFESIKKAIVFASEKLPNFTVLTVNSHFVHNQGSTIARELAITLATAAEYVLQLQERGVEPTLVNNHLKFSLSVGGSYFMEIAKVRALKKLWPKIMEGFGVPKAPMPFIHAQTSMRSLKEEENANRIQVTTEAMSAAIAGVDSLTVLPADMLYGAPTDFSNRIARNVQHLLKSESYMDRVYDPAAGSYYIEVLTEKVAEIAWSKFLKIEDAGGIFGILQ